MQVPFSLQLSGVANSTGFPTYCQQPETQFALSLVVNGKAVLKVYGYTAKGENSNLEMVHFQ